MQQLFNPGRPVDDATLNTLRQKAPGNSPLIKPAVPVSAPAQPAALAALVLLARTEAEVHRPIYTLPSIRSALLELASDFE